MFKVDIKDLKKMAKALNKAELTDEPVDAKQELEGLQEDFISAIEEIDDANKIDEVDDKIIDFYEALIDPKNKGGAGKATADEPKWKKMDEDDAAEFAEKNELEVLDEDGDPIKYKKIAKMDEDDAVKAVKAAWEKKQAASAKEDKGGKDDAPNFDKMDDDDLLDLVKKEGLKVLDKDGDKLSKKELKDLSEKKLRKFVQAAWEKANAGSGETEEKEKVVDLDEMDKDALIAHVKDKGLKLKDKGGDKIKKGDLDDHSAKKLRKYIKAATEDATPKDDDDKGGKDKKDGKVKGLRAGSLPAKVHDAIADGGATMKALCKLVGKEKDKKPEDAFNLTMRTIIRKVSAAIPVTAVLKGEDDIKFSVAGDKDDD